MRFWITPSSNPASEQARDLGSQSHVLSIGNHLGLFSEASDQPEGHEQGGGAEGVKGQESLQGVKFYVSF